MKLIITAAITGGEPVHRGMTPYVPTTVDEITEEETVAEGEAVSGEPDEEVVEEVNEQ